MRVGYAWRLLASGEIARISNDRASSVMIEKFATSCSRVAREFLDLNHTSKSISLVSLVVPKFAL
jgi:hypothetical protein